MRPLIAVMLRSRLSAVGFALAASSGAVFLFLVGLQLMGQVTNPYAGIIVYLMLPTLFALGDALILIGLWRDRARRRRDATAPAWPSLDLSTPTARGTLWFIGGATLASLGLLSFASFGAVGYSESQDFCGQTCHNVMGPQFAAHASGPHGRVPCVSCHIEPGAQGFLKAKMDGTRQLRLVATGTYPRPIPSPPQNNAPNVHTSCEQCHWPDRFIGDVIKVVYEYADDSVNTETRTTLRMHVGGPISGTTSGIGIHWHMNRGNRVEYVALDAKLEQIPYVKVTGPNGSAREFFGKGFTDRDLAGKTLRQMVCTDCHNRPAHRFGSSPEASVDAAIGVGQISAKIPFIRREAVKALSTEYASQEAALAGIASGMHTGLQRSLPADGGPALEQAIAVTQGIYRRNVFPTMKIGWGTYNYQIGHTVTQGCYRCHDDEHKSRDGAVISQDCEQCHTVE